MIASRGAGPRLYTGPVIMTGPLTLHAFPGTSLRMGAPISGTGDLKTGGAGTIIDLDAANGYTGSTIPTSSRVRIVANHRIPDNSRVELLPLSQLDLNGFDETIGGLVSLSPTGVVLGGGTLTVATKAGTTDTYAGSFVGAGNVVKTGTGTWVLTGTSASAAPMQVSAGTVRVMGSIANTITLAGGALEGTGTVGSIAGATGTLRPGASPGVLHSKSVALGAGVAVGFLIDGPAVGTEYAQLDVTGSVNLGGASLALKVDPNFLPAGAGDLIIVDNDGADPIVGTFSGLPEGASSIEATARPFASPTRAAPATTSC